MDLLHQLLATAPIAAPAQVFERSTPLAADELAWLSSLLEQPIAPASAGCGATAARLPQLDRLLLVAQNLLFGAAFVALGAWLVSEPLPFWLHRLQAAEPARVEASLPLRLAGEARSGQPAVPAQGEVPTPVLSRRGASFSQAQAPEVELGMLPQQLPEPVPALPALQPSRLEIPAIGLDTAVVEMFVNDEWRWELPEYAAGYMHGTALPGEHSTMGISGHAGLFGGVFANLGMLAPGDEIVVEAAGWRYRYRVRELRVVWPSQSEVLEPMGRPLLALITCTNWDLQRLVVFAEQIEARPIIAQ